MEEPASSISLDALVLAQQDGMRLDQAAAELFPDYSRSRLQHWIRTGCLRLNQATARSKDRVYIDDRLELRAETEPQQAWQAESLPLDVVYEDESIAVINKPAGLVTHPGAGNTHGTLANGLLALWSGQQSGLPRAGIVHRLDKDTSGLLVVARSLPAHQSLVEQLQARTVKREYRAIVWGRPPGSGTIDKAIARHSQHRQKMAVKAVGGKPAITHFQALEYFESFALMQLNLETGRTHQIRVHMADLGFPLIGDPLYGRKRAAPRMIAEPLREALNRLQRQALHACHLSLEHPQDGRPMSWRADMPADMVQLLSLLRA